MVLVTVLSCKQKWTERYLAEVFGRYQETHKYIRCIVSHRKLTGINYGKSYLSYPG